MENHITHNKMLIAGPCALESKEQLVECIEHLHPLGVTHIRACLWKPRTAPGWEGLGFSALPILLEETLSRGLVPCTEILTPAHALQCIEALKDFGEDAPMLLWIGSRNQNHFIINDIAQIAALAPENVHLMFKNQMWMDEKHWFGIYQHIINAGFPKERLLACHRGFNVGKGPNLEELRNLPDFEMSMQMRRKMDIPMILDPSHIGGKRDKVFKTIKKSLNYDYDGYMIEVHHDVLVAKTDADQQLTFDQYTDFLSMIDHQPVYRKKTA